MNEIRDIHNPFKAWLDERGIPFHRNRPDKKTTALKGDPDFLLTWCNYCVYIECKVPGGKLSKDQEKRIAYLRKAGNPVVIAYNLQDCLEAAKNILRRAGCEKLASEAQGRSDCPLNNKHAAELIAAETDLSGGSGENHDSAGTAHKTQHQTERPAEMKASCAGSDQPAQNLWIASLRGVDTVFYGDPNPGGLARILRKASPQDIRDLLPRK